MVRIFLWAIYPHDDRTTLILNGGNSPITIDNILPDEIGEHLEDTVSSHARCSPLVTKRKGTLKSVPFLLDSAAFNRSTLRYFNARAGKAFASACSVRQVSIVSFIFTLIADFFKRKHQPDSLRFKLFCNCRHPPALLPPDPKNIRDTTSGAFTNIDQIEHLQHGSIAGVGDTTALCRVDFDMENRGWP